MTLAFRLGILSLLLCFACGTAQGSAPVSAIPAAVVSVPPFSQVQQGVLVANEIRRQNALPEFTLDPILTAVAQAHAEDMRDRGYFDHDSPEGKTPFQRMSDAGLRYSAAAENIAMGASDPRHAFDLWLGSPGHRHNLLNKVYGRHGLGFAGGYWVHDFAD